MTETIVILGLLAAMLAQAAIYGLAERRHAEDRRFLVNHILAGTPSEFVQLSAASRPDEVVVDIAEARQPRPVTRGPLGL